MHVGFHHLRFEALAALWNSCLPESYAVSPKLLSQNTVESPLFDWGASVVEIDDDAKPLGFVAVKRSAAQLYRGPDPDMAHITAIVAPNPHMGIELVASVKKNLLNRGIYKLVFGQDSRHFFPGCPADCAFLKDLLTVEGFSAGGETYDLQHDLADFEPLEKAMARMESGPEKVSVEPIRTDQVEGLDRFLKREFPGRWRYDTASKIKTEGRSDFIHGLWVDGDLHGFAVTQDEAHELPIAGAVFNKGFGAKWCTLGPIGVSSAIRGRGLGDSLLASSLLALKRQGKRLCTIDWTHLKDWYGKHGFQVSRTYIPFSVKLEEVV